MKQCTKCKGTDIQQKFVGWYDLKDDYTSDDQYYEDEYYCKDCQETVDVEGENEPK